MVTVNIHQAKAQPAKPVDRAVNGDAFGIAKAGTPLVKVRALGGPKAPQRLEFLSGEIAVPRHFDRLGESAIAALLQGRRTKLTFNPRCARNHRGSGSDQGTR